MRRMITVFVMAAVMLLATASVALAAPNARAGCAGESNHGEHIQEYLELGIAAGGGAAHFGVDASPGASFCQESSAPNLGADHKPIR